MFILNKYTLTGTAAAAAAGAANNVNPSVVTGATGNSAGIDFVTPIVTSVVYGDQIISKIVALTIPAAGLGVENNYITVPISQLGINGIKSVLAATLLGVYNPNSIETAVGGVGGGTPSFIGIWDKTVTNITSLSIQADTLVLRIPTAQITLFANKTAMIQLFYHS